VREPESLTAGQARCKEPVSNQQKNKGQGELKTGEATENAGESDRNCGTDI